MSERERPSIVALDEAAYNAALALQRGGPRADYTIAQLPQITSTQPGDLVPVYRNGQTYALVGSATAFGATLPLSITNGGTGTSAPGLIAGANVTITGTWPNQTITSTATGAGVATVTATAPVVSSGGANPVISLTHGDYVDLTANQTVAGIKTFSSAPVMSGASITAGTIPIGVGGAQTGVLPITNGGTGSATQNFVDLTTNQTVAGIKTFSSAPVMSGASITAGTVNIGAGGAQTGILPVANGGTGTASPGLIAGSNVTVTGTWPNQTIAATAGGAGVSGVTATAPVVSSGGGTPNISLSHGDYVDLTTNQSVGGVKTFTAIPVFPNNTITQAEVTSGYVDLVNNQTVAGVKNFSSTVNANSGLTPGQSNTAGTATIYGGSGIPAFSAASASLYQNYSGGNVYQNTSNSGSSGTSWTPLTVGTRVIFNVLDYGAKGDGVTDDHAAIQAAMNASAGKGICWIPVASSSYLCGTSMLMPSNLELCIDGTLLMTPGSNQGFFYSGAGVTDVHIFGYGTLNINGANQSNVNAYGISVSNATNVVLENITISNAYYFPVAGAGNTNFLQRNLTINNPQNTGSTGLGVAGNQASSTPSTNCWIVNCNISNTKDEAISFYGQVVNSGAIGNVINGATYGICCLNDSGQIPPSNGVTITDNVVTGCTYPAILIDTNNGEPGYHKNVIIANNHIYSNSSNSMFISSVSNCIIANNIIHQNSSGMYVALGVSGTGNITITGNRIFDEGYPGTGGVGITTVGSIPNLNISNNVFYNTNGTPMGTAIVSAGGNQYTQYGNSYFGLTGQTSDSENQRTERAIIGISVSSTSVIGNLVGTATVTWNTPFTSSAAYTVTATAENAGTGAVVPIIVSKAGSNCQVYLYALQAISAGLVYVNVIASAV